MLISHAVSQMCTGISGLNLLFLSDISIHVYSMYAFTSPARWSVNVPEVCVFYSLCVTLTHGHPSDATRLASYTKYITLTWMAFIIWWSDLSVTAANRWPNVKKVTHVRQQWHYGSFVLRYWHVIIVYIYIYIYNCWKNCYKMAASMT